MKQKKRMQHLVSSTEEHRFCGGRAGISPLYIPVILSHMEHFYQLAAQL